MLGSPILPMALPGCFWDDQHGSGSCWPLQPWQGSFAVLLKPGCAGTQRCDTVGMDAGVWILTLAYSRKWGSSRVRPSAGSSEGGVGCPWSEVWRVWLRCLEVSVGLSTCGLQGVEIAP